MTPMWEPSDPLPPDFEESEWERRWGLTILAVIVGGLMVMGFVWLARLLWRRVCC